MLSFMTSSLGSAPAQRLVPGINTSWQGPRPHVFLSPLPAALPSGTWTHHPPHVPRQGVRVGAGLQVTPRPSRGADWSSCPAAPWGCALCR